MQKVGNIIRPAVIIGLIIIGNLLLGNYFLRLDLTSEKRYSLSPYTRQVAEGLDRPMKVTVYMEGEFPPNIRVFQDAVRTLLLEIKSYAGQNLDFEFVDPSTNAALRKEFQQQGLAPIPVRVQVSATETKNQYLWPYAEIVYNQQDTYIDLLKGSSQMTTQGPQINFTKAEAELEYALVSGMRRLLPDQRGVVGFLQGHGEVDLARDGRELLTAIQNNYEVLPIDLREQRGYEISPTVNVLVVMQPTQAFSERDKYELDQYLIRGGRILWMLDYQEVDLDMFQKQSTLTQLRELNLDDLFLNYGFKLNYDLVQDLECEATEVMLPGPGGKASFLSKKWIFYPLSLSLPDHPIARNIDAVLMRYASSIDTFPQPDQRKSVFLKSSTASRTVQGSQYINLDEILRNPPPRQVFNRRDGVITGLLIEGLFNSVFVGRQAPTDSLAPNPPEARFGPKNNPTAPGALAVIADGEFGLGKSFRGQRQYIPYDNKTLLLNTLDYLAGDAALTQIRAKDLTVRRIDRQKAQNHAVLLRVLNLGLPLVLLVVFGLVRRYMRRQREARRQVSG